jgi:5-formyltetrahydrofolate cyclo-ligase
MRRLLRERQPASDQACAALQTWLLAHPALRTIAVYSPLPGEVDLSPVLTRLPEIDWVYPKIIGHHLTFHAGDRLLPGAHGILEPHADTPEIPLGKIDAFICPGLAFDPRGGRLGRGRGFYDRMLANARPDAIKLGVCFEIQWVADTFPEPHDILMDRVISG